MEEPRSVQVPLTGAEFVAVRTLALRRHTTLGKLVADLIRRELADSEGEPSPGFSVGVPA
jgi:hypothetical protein